MKAENSKNIETWLKEAENRTLALPEFQRRVVWDHKKCEKLLEAIIYKNPIGIFLLLFIDPNNAPFETRFIEGIDGDRQQHTTFLLLDGQQRITSLFRAFNRSDQQAAYYVKYNTSESGKIEVEEILTIKPSTRTNEFIGNSTKEYSNNYIPLTILNPAKDSILVEDWITEIDTRDNTEQLKRFCLKLRNVIGQTVIPHFSLPQSTLPESAIEIYLNLNTQSVKLTEFYRAVGLMYRDTTPSQSLLKIIEELEIKVPLIRGMESTDPDNLFMKVACLKQDKVPTDGAYKNIDYKKLYNERTSIINGINWAVNHMKRLKIGKGKQLPSSVPLRVLPAIHKVVIEQTHSRKDATRKIVNKYVWHAFLTNRYEKSAATILKKDVDDIIDLLQSDSMRRKLEIFKLERPSEQDLIKAKWPGSIGTLERAILVACQLDGAVDIETGKGLSYPSDDDWNLDHIFPRTRLKRIGLDPDIALNCMLLDPTTNKKFSSKLPGTRIINLQERIKNESGKTLTKEAIKNRYEKQLIPAGAFGTLISLNNEKASNAVIKSEYIKFLEQRAKAVKHRIDILLDQGEI